jgi:aminotransferase
VIEDSANSISSSYKGKMCGTLGDAGVFSFDSMKILVMIDGGVLVMKDPEAYQRAEAMRYLGLTPKTTSGMDALKEKKNRWWEYELDTVSGRFISNDVLAAIGREQLKKLPAFIARRKQIWEIYQREVANLAEITCAPEPKPGTTGTYYLYWLQLARRDELAAYLLQNGVYTTFRYFPLHMVKLFATGCTLPNAERANENTLNLPLHQNLTDSEIEQICNLVRKFAG